jgi:predicted lipoprotein with Yx(FWY)xxD motif
MKRATLIVAVGLLVGACGSSSTTPTQPAGSTTGGSPSGGATSNVSISTGTVSGLGTVLVDSQGKTLYTFAPDQAKKVTCTASCAQVWPPLKVPSGQKASVSAGAKASLVSSDPNPSGGSVVTYNGWPLYTYAADQAAGTAHGQALNLNGGFWYVITPDGKVIKAKAKKGSGY